MTAGLKPRHSVLLAGLKPRHSVLLAGLKPRHYVLNFELVTGNWKLENLHASYCFSSS